MSAPAPASSRWWWSMSSIRGTTRSGSSASRALNEPRTESALAALAGPVTSVRAKRSNVGSEADGKVAPASRLLTERKRPWLRGVDPDDVGRQPQIFKGCRLAWVAVDTDALAVAHGQHLRE